MGGSVVEICGCLQEVLWVFGLLYGLEGCLDWGVDEVRLEGVEGNRFSFCLIALELLYVDY